MGFAGREGDGVTRFQIVSFAIDSHACSAFEHDEQLVHVGMGVGGEDFARGDNNPCDLGERGQVTLVEPDLFLRRGIVTDRFFGCAVDAAEMHRGGQDERLRDSRVCETGCQATNGQETKRLEGDKTL